MLGHTLGLQGGVDSTLLKGQFIDTRCDGRVQQILTDTVLR